MRAGSLRQRGTLQKLTRGSDGQGGHTATWSPRAVVNFGLEPLTGREQIAAAQIQGVLSSAVTMRYRSDVQVKDRIVWMRRTLEIASVMDPDGHRDELRLLVSEVQ